MDFGRDFMQTRTSRALAVFNQCELWYTEVPCCGFGLIPTRLILFSLSPTSPLPSILPAYALLLFVSCENDPKAVR